MRLTIPHYFDFGADHSVVGDDLGQPGAWDALRTNTDGIFSLPASREDWERNIARRTDIQARADAIETWLSAHSSSSLASYGVGGAKLELSLHQLNPERQMTISDYAPATVEHLRKLFPEASVQGLDLRTEGPLGASIHLFHRIEPEFTNAEWRGILKRFSGSDILFVADDIIGYKRVLRELRVRYGSRTSSKAGLLRNRAAFESLWRETHTAEPVRFHDLDGWALTPN